MSCKVLAHGGAPARSLFGGLPESPRPRTGADAPAECEISPNGQVAELHGRIVDLEQALQTNVRQARDAGFRDGEKAGRERAAAELHPVLERVAKSLADIATVRARLRREAEQDLVALSIAIARRILRRELSVEPEAIQGLVKAALEKVQSRESCKIRMHPSHSAFVRKHLEMTGISIEVNPDPALQPGDLIIETGRGDLDASVETQLREIERGFADRLRESN